MTAAIRGPGEASASPGTDIVATEPLWGPEPIEGHFEGYLSAAAVLDRLATIDEPFDALVMAGFGEPGRERSMSSYLVSPINVSAVWRICRVVQ